jgi:hypothetical protein
MVPVRVMLTGMKVPAGEISRLVIWRRIRTWSCFVFDACLEVAKAATALRLALARVAMLTGPKGEAAP